jgi:hypothetical protein
MYIVEELKYSYASFENPNCLGFFDYTNPGARVAPSPTITSG